MIQLVLPGFGLFIGGVGCVPFILGSEEVSEKKENNTS